MTRFPGVVDLRVSILIFLVLYDKQGKIDLNYFYTIKVSQFK